MTLPGIDISSYQSTTPSLTGLAFAFAKASEGNFADAKYQMHIANIRKAGLTTGAYHFSRASLGTPQAQAAFFLLTAGSVDLYALDVEGTDAFSLAQCEAFITAMHQAGKRIGMYHSLSGFPHAGQDWDWVAYYNPTAPTISWDFWQFGPRTIGLQKVDGDTFNGDAAQLAALAGGGMAITTTITVLPYGGGTFVVPANTKVTSFTISDTGAIVPGPSFGPAVTPSSAAYDARVVTTATKGNPFLRVTNGTLAGHYISAAAVTETPNPPPTTSGTPTPTVLAPGLYEVA